MSPLEIIVICSVAISAARAVPTVAEREPDVVKAIKVPDDLGRSRIYMVAHELRMKPREKLDFSKFLPTKVTTSRSSRFEDYPAEKNDIEFERRNSQLGFPINLLNVREKLGSLKRTVRPVHDDY